MGYGSNDPATATKSSPTTRATKHDLILVKLSPDQITAAKEANGRRRRITHALLCGPYGQRFDTERQCRRYFDAWDPAREMFPGLFRKAIETEHYCITDYHTTWDLVGTLIRISEADSSE